MVVPPKHPKMIIFSRKAPWLLGYHHFRNPPYIPKNIKFQPPAGGLWSDGFAGADPPVVVMSWKITAQKLNILLMEEILHQLIGSLSHYLQGFIHPRWCKISSTNSRYQTIDARTWVQSHIPPQQLRGRNTTRQTHIYTTFTMTKEKNTTHGCTTAHTNLILGIHFSFQGCSWFFLEHLAFLIFVRLCQGTFSMWGDGTFSKIVL